MKNLIALTLALVAMSITLAPVGADNMMAAGKPKASAMAPVKCPSCGMPMPSKATKTMTVPIYLAKSKRTVYCCPICPSGKKAAAYFKTHHKPMSVPM